MVKRMARCEARTTFLARSLPSVFSVVMNPTPTIGYALVTSRVPTGTPAALRFTTSLLT